MFEYEAKHASNTMAEVNAMRIVNLTPHTLNVEDANGVLHAIAPSGQISRVATTRETLPEVAGFPVSRAAYGEIEGLPAPEEGTIFVVSGMILAALQGSRPDVFSPGELVRNEAGQPIGCRGLTAG